MANKTISCGQPKATHGKHAEKFVDGYEMLRILRRDSLL